MVRHRATLQILPCSWFAVLSSLQSRCSNSFTVMPMSRAILRSNVGGMSRPE